MSELHDVDTAARPGEDWRPLADQVALHARDFLDGVAALARGEGGEETVPLLLLEVAQIHAGRGASSARARTSSCPATGSLTSAPTLTWTCCGRAWRRGCSMSMSTRSCSTRTPTRRPPRSGCPTISPRSRRTSSTGCSTTRRAGSSEALWWWQYSYVSHWGLHGGAALRALHAVVAHARLDVAEEETPRV